MLSGRTNDKAMLSPNLDRTKGSVTSNYSYNVTEKFDYEELRKFLNEDPGKNSEMALKKL